MGLIQVIMLGTAGTIAAEIFVLTGHAAGIAGPETVLAIVIGGMLTVSIAINYCELATTYPFTGGAMTYVKEAFGTNLIMFQVGSLDALSSTFYAALSAVGFAYSLKIFFPSLPLIPVAMAVIFLVGLLHVRGVTQVGNLQIFLGAFLLIVFGLYVILGLVNPNGFDQRVFESGRVLFEDQSFFATLGRMLTTVALIYNAYVGFEVIADDAEEIKKPNRNIPIGILVSLGITTLVYTLVSYVTIGVVPYQALAGSETALTDAVSVFWPKLGVPLMGMAGIVATLTSINSAMLSATRETFTLSRDQVWPRFLSRLSRWRTPYTAIIAVVIVSALITVIGLVDFLSFISSAGYMFVLFWASLAMVRLHKLHPTIERPFKAPLFPLTAYLAAGSGLLIIAFADLRALLFLGGVIVILSIGYFISQYAKKKTALQAKINEQLGGGRILVAAINPKTAMGLVDIASRIAEHQEDTSICLLTVIKTPAQLLMQKTEELVQDCQDEKMRLLMVTAPIAQARNVAFSIKAKIASNVESAIYREIGSPNPIQMIMLGWPREETKLRIPNNLIKEILFNAHRDVVIYRGNGSADFKSILLPISGGPDYKLALRLAKALALHQEVKVCALYLIPDDLGDEELEDAQLFIQDLIEAELGELPVWIETKVVRAQSVHDGILSEVMEHAYDLVIIGAGSKVYSPSVIFGTLDDRLIEDIQCPIMIVRHYQSEALTWFNQRLHRFESLAESS